MQSAGDKAKAGLQAMQAKIENSEGWKHADRVIQSLEQNVQNLEQKIHDGKQRLDRTFSDAKQQLEQTVCRLEQRIVRGKAAKEPSPAEPTERSSLKSTTAAEQPDKTGGGNHSNSAS